MFLAVPEITTIKAPSDSDNASPTSASLAETTSHVLTTNTVTASDHMTTSHDSSTSTTNTVIVLDSGIDQSSDLGIIKIIIVTLVPVAMVTIVLPTVAVLVIVVAMMWRKRCEKRKNSTSTNGLNKMDSHSCYCNANESDEFNMDQNVSYNICETDALSQHYEYPDFSTTILNESNIYDSIDSQ